MKLIFSRKGFDSASGGVPSPIFPDGKLLSLPIPDKTSSILYSDLEFNGHNLGDLVSCLSKNKVRRDYCTHLDPDLRRSTLARHRKWKPLFGQAGAAQGHLERQHIQHGDIFLFFGLFQRTISTLDGLRYDRTSRPVHHIWGWLQIGDIYQVLCAPKEIAEWASYHPHFKMSESSSNTIYISKDFLEFGNQKLIIEGAGTFPNYSEQLLLTAKGQPKSSFWKLPAFMYPAEIKDALTYHKDPDKWKVENNASYLSSVGRGQEFVLDCSKYPDSLDWIEKTIGQNKEKSPCLKRPRTHDMVENQA